MKNPDDWEQKSNQKKIKKIRQIHLCIQITGEFLLLFFALNCLWVLVFFGVCESASHPHSPVSVTCSGGRLCGPWAGGHAWRGATDGPAQRQPVLLRQSAHPFHRGAAQEWLLVHPLQSHRVPAKLHRHREFLHLLSGRVDVHLWVGVGGGGEWGVAGQVKRNAWDIYFVNSRCNGVCVCAWLLQWRQNN